MNAEEIIGKVLDGRTITDGETAFLLSAEGEDMDLLFRTAAQVRDRMFGKDVFVYGFVYFSTYCRNDCAFCNYRSSKTMHRYRKTPEEVLRLSDSLAEAGVNLVDLTMGEDPRVYSDGGRYLADIVRKIRDSSDIGIMVSPGAMGDGAIKDLGTAGADWLAVYQETYDRQRFSGLRPGQDFDFRAGRRKVAMENGMLAEDGILVGTGESALSRAASIRLMRESGCDQIRAMTFVPQADTPMSSIPAGDTDDELRAIAVMRLLYPDRFIPASLDVEGISGLRTRIDAGANVITSVIPPFEELAGVAQPELDIDDGGRSVDRVRRLLSDMGRRVADLSQYRKIIDSRKEMLRCRS